jgi:2-dehydropantoate 2-reductase
LRTPADGFCQICAVSTIAVLGPGGVGGFVAAALARSGADVAVIARDQTASVIAARGISVRSAALGSFTARVRCMALLSEDVDFLIVATKATGLPAALGRVQAAPELVVPLLNGLEHMERLRSRLGQSLVAAGVIRIESDRPAPGEIVQTSPSARVDLATDEPALRARLATLGSALETAGIQVRIGTGERQVLWSKLARLNALALTTSASDRPIGFVRSDPRWRSALNGAIAETVAVANADGARLQAGDTLAELEQAHAELGSSMQRDIASGREPELDAIAGAVLRAGARHGLRCPTVQWLAERVAARARIPAPGVS